MDDRVLFVVRQMLPYCVKFDFILIRYSFCDRQADNVVFIILGEHLIARQLRDLAGEHRRLVEVRQVLG